MRKSVKVIALTVLLSFVIAVGRVSAAPVPEALLTAPTAAVVDAEPAAPPAVPPAGALATPPASIRHSLEMLRQSPLVLQPNRREKADAAVQSTGGRGLSTAAKTAIWLSAVTVAGVWAYKTFSVTRGTD